MNINLKPKMRGALLVATSGMLFGCMGFLGTRLFEFALSIEAMLFWRFLIATLWILIATFISMRNSFRIDKHSVPVLKTLILSALAYSGGSAFYFFASKHIGTGLAMVIFFSFPVFVALFSYLSGTWKMNFIAFIALFAVVTGLILLKGNSTSSLDNVGIVLAILGAICFASYVYGSQHTAKHYNAELLTLSVCFSNTLIFLAWSCYTNTFMIPTSWQAWFYICALGIVATALPIQLLLSGLKYISPVKASILSVLEPAVTVMIGLIFLHESVTFTQVMGIMILLSGAILIQFERSY